jgi:hypothetical protein
MRINTSVITVLTAAPFKSNIGMRRQVHITLRIRPNTAYKVYSLLVLKVDINT